MEYLLHSNSTYCNIASIRPLRNPFIPG
uniref:Uncharacterized protein n=1 Tax=Anguilla anguilla TaxID=7936 RepID=A0A0E9RJ61_ANGAN